jgi:hypothetical protein
MIVPDALSVLEAALERAAVETVQTPDLRAALTALEPHCRDHQPLDHFWQGAGSLRRSTRSNMLSFALGEIRLQLAS